MTKSRRPSIPWTDNAIVRLKYLADSGKTAGEAAADMGRTREAVNSVAAKLGIRFNGKRGRPTATIMDETIRYAVECAGKGMRLSEVIVHLNVSGGTLRRELKNRGVRLTRGRKRLWTPERLAKLRSLMKSGMSAEQVAAKLKVSLSSAYAHVRQSNLSFKRGCDK